jgi:hypothetical protein
MDIAQRHGNADRKAQVDAELNGASEQPLERLAPGVFQREHGAASVADELQRPYSGRSVEGVLQSVFVRQTIKHRWRRSLRG